MLKILWYILFIVSWCSLELSWGLVLACTWIVLKIYCWMSRSLSKPSPTTVTTVENTRGVTAVTGTTASAVTNACSCYQTSTSRPTNAQTNSIVDPAVSRSEAIGTSTEKATDKSRTTQQCSSAASKSLPNSSPPSSSVVSEDKRIATTSPCSFGAPVGGEAVRFTQILRQILRRRRRRRAAHPTNPVITPSVTTCSTITTTTSAAIENVTVKPNDVRPAPVIVAEDAATCTDSTVRYPLESCVRNGGKESVTNYATANTVTNTSNDSCFVTSINIESNSVHPEVSRRTADKTSAGKAIDKPCTTEHRSSAQSELLPSSPLSSSLPVVPATSSTVPVVLARSSPVATTELRGQSSATRHAADLENPAVTTSSVSNLEHFTASSASNTAYTYILTKHAAVDEIKNIQDNSNRTSIQACANIRSTAHKQKPSNSASQTAVANVQRVSQSSEHSSTLSSPNTALQCSAVSASTSQDTNAISQHPAKSAVENISYTPDNLSSAPVTVHKVSVKCPDSTDGYPLNKCAKNDGKMSDVASSSSLSSSASSLPSCHGIRCTQFNCNGTSADTAAERSTTQTESDERPQFPLSDEYEFRLVCDMCFKLKTEQMMPDRAHSCRQDILAVKKFGTSQWHWIRQRKLYVNFKGDYLMCNKRQEGESCYNGCTYAHCDAERQLWNLEKKSTFNIANFISARQRSVPICSVKFLLDKYPVRTSSVFLIEPK